MSRRKNDLSQRLEAVIKTLVPQQEQNPDDLGPMMRAIKAVHSISDHTSTPPEDLERQRAAEELFARLVTPGIGIRSDSLTVGSIPAEWVSLEHGHDRRHAVLYCHGGGYTCGQLGYARILASKLALATGFDVLSFEYRLAPEHPFPAAIEDAVAMWDYLMYMGYGARDVIVAGDSAGGNLALELALKLKEQGRAQPRGLVLFSPWTDMTASGKSYRTCKTLDPMLTMEYIAAVREAYTGPDADWSRPCYSPLFADLRGLPIFTIDSAETKDIDDAISLMKTQNGGYELGVHIADVSHYVRPDTALDKEAYERATSIYYADKVIPMLPTQLSNGICSLNEGEERLAFSCLMQLDESGNIHSYQFVKSVIRSRVKGVYKEINALLDGSNDPALVTKYKDVMAQLPAMTELYEKRLALRKARGAMDIESDEAKLVMDEEGRCVDIVKRTRGVSECMIEEFMLLANQCAANAGRTHHVPFVYRIHEAPDAERMEKLSNTLKACGLNVHFAGEVPTQLELSAILDETRGQPIQIPVHTGILRSMQKARYSPEPKGHYGLVLADYAHFTSPIRRYPDLAIHRILTDMLVGKPEQELIKDYTGFATHASEQSSRQEVSAVRIERDVEDLYKAEYMHNHLGEVYTGTVAGVTPRGIFVALENTVEGFVPAAQLCKGEATVVEGVSILDPLTGKRWMLGDPVKVQVAGANVALGRIDFDYMPL